jgi:hypothetical protein
MASLLDQGQVIRNVHDLANEALQVKQIAGSLVTDKYNELELTYVASGNGVGEIETVIFKQDGTTVATLTLSYNGDNKLVGVVKS